MSARCRSLERNSLPRQLRQIAESVQDDPDSEIREQHAQFARHVEALSIKRSADAALDEGTRLLLAYAPACYEDAIRSTPAAQRGGN